MFELLRKFKTEHSTGVWAVATVSSSVAVSAGGESLKWWSLDNASLSNNNNSGNSNSAERTVPLAHRAGITSVATTRNKQFLATSSLDGHVKVWSTSDATELKDLHVGPLESWAVAFEASLPDDTPLDQLRLVTTCQSGASALSLWSLADAAKVATYNATASLSAAAVNVAVAYSPDGRLLASAAMDGSVSLFDANAGTKRHTFAAHSMAVRALAFSADSSTLITASDDAQIRVHDVESCSPIVSLSGHSSWVLSIANSPDRKRFASGSADKTVRVWDVGNPQALHVFSEHTDKVWSVAWTPNASRIISGSDDGTLCVYNAPL